ncbi:MAG: hypothetical protein QNK23_05385 [Crocinitomicaceae bacterium]|nr:hypothetical protein [Crocinitomicaceae bacterium]
MKTALYLLLVSVLVLTSCSNSEAQAGMRSHIEEKEAEITTLSEELAPGEKLDPKEKEELIVLLNEYVEEYPEDPFAPECLSRIHMIYSSESDYIESVEYADRIINEYPEYINRALIIESQAGSFDIWIKPRDTTKVRYYYELLLSEYPDLPKEKVDDIQERLDNLDLTIEQIIMQNN